MKPERQVLTIRVPVELHRRLRYVCWRDGVNANELVVELLEERLKDIELPSRVEDDEDAPA